jgi:two-component system cell cycle sensor histidine kinase/response regulator CckA
MTDHIRLLVCEDSDDDAVLIVRRLERGGLGVDYERVDTASATAEALRLRPPDLVISDYSMPGFGAEAALALLRESGLDAPFILVSGRVGDESAVALMRAGAHDFIVKGRMARLVPAVRRELRQAEGRRERRAAQEALRMSEERFRLFAEHAPDVIFRYQVRPTPDVEYLSPAAAGVLGRSPQQLCGDPRTVFSLVLPEDRERLEASWRSPEPGPLVVRWRRPDGGEAWTEQRAVALRDESGAVVAVEGILRDITDRVRADAERDRLHQQLRQAERLESLGRLAGGVAHDFNNLLALILGRADLALADLPGDGAQRADLEIIRRLAERGGELTRRLLVFSRQEPLDPRILDVNKVVADTEQVLHGTIGEDVEFVTRLDPAPCPVLIDRGELERLLLNLVANSRRAMPHGGRLSVETANIAANADAGTDAGAGDPAGALVRLTVTDTGTGMPQDVAKHVFEPFFTTDAGTGTGLGLSMAYSVVKGAGGEISLDSAPDRGTTVRIDLPAAEPTAAAPEDERRQPNGGAGETVLVVEDDDDVRGLVERMLTRSGYRVLAAASPAAAVSITRTADGPIDLLLSDVVMPGISGIELIGRVRETFPGLPVLLMSGYTAGALPDNEPPPPGTVLIRKPFTTAALLYALDGLLGHT